MEKYWNDKAKNAAPTNTLACCIYLAPQDEDGVDVGEDAMKTEVNVGTNQRENGGQNTGSRLELWSK